MVGTRGVGGEALGSSRSSRRKWGSSGGASAAGASEPATSAARSALAVPGRGGCTRRGAACVHTRTTSHTT